MRKLIFLLILFIITKSVYALDVKEYQSPMTPYLNNYFIMGDHNEDQIKFQFSMKYNLLWPFESGIYFGYTQLAYWRIYDDRSPFDELNYMPEFFYRFTSGNNIFNDYTIPYVDYIQVSPYFHRSNGRDGEDSRGEDKFYAEIQISRGDKVVSGARLRVFGYYNTQSRNDDINKYNKFYSSAVFLQLESSRVQNLEKEKIEVSWGGNPASNGWVQVELSTRIATTYFQPRLFIQYYDGYDEFLLYYNDRNRALRAGISF